MSQLCKPLSLKVQGQIKQHQFPNLKITQKYTFLQLKKITDELFKMLNIQNGRIRFPYLLLSRW